MKSPLAAVKRQRFPARASRQVRGLFILGLGSSPTTKELLHGLFYETSRDGLVKNVRPPVPVEESFSML